MDLKCKHYKGDGYMYTMCGEVLLICSRCEALLRKDILKQIKLEQKTKGR